MYVFYPASQLVDLTVNYREIAQAIPFPSRNLTPSVEHPQQPLVETPEFDSRTLQVSLQSTTRPPKSVSPKRKSESPRNKSDSQLSLQVFLKSDKKPSPSPVLTRKTELELTLEENLRNLEVYRNKVPLKRSRSLHTNRSEGVAFDFRMAKQESVLRDMIHPSLNDTLKNHHVVTFKLVKTVSEFTEALGQIYERHAEEMQLLVANFRKKNSELRKERPACASSLFHTWETMLQEVEIDSQAQIDIGNILGRQVSRLLIDKSFFRKIQSRKIFTQREALEGLIRQQEEKLAKTRIEYKTAYLAYMNGPSVQALAQYINCHNEYVAQLHITNGMLGHYHSEILPQLLLEVEEVYNDLCTVVCESVLQGSEMISSRAQEQSRRYESLSAQCKAVSGSNDLTHLMRSVQVPTSLPPIRRQFAAPQPPQPQEGPDGQPMPIEPSIAQNLPPPLKNEIVQDRLATIQVRERFEAAKKEYLELETQVKQLTDALHTLTRVQQRSIDSNLFNKVNELQEDISAKQYELNLALLRLSSVKAQKELFGSKVDGNESSRDRKMSASSTGSMKLKWMKALKSLKTSPSNGQTAKETDKKSGKEGLMSMPTDGNSHNFQDYTYKKITPCDVCSQVLRGHTRQGLKCKVCKLNVHVDCQDKAPKCQQKSRLLRRQKSTSEIDTKIVEPTIDEDILNRPSTTAVRQVHYDFGPDSASLKGRTQSQTNLVDTEPDQVYQVLKQASDLRTRNLSDPEPHLTPERTPAAVEKPAYYGNKSSSKSYVKNEEYPLTAAGEYYSSSPNKFSKPNRSENSLNNAACFGSSVGTSSAVGPRGEFNAEPSRRQHGPLLLTRGNTSLSVGPVPHATSSDQMDTRQRRKLFSGFKSLSVFGGKSRVESSEPSSPTHTPHSPRRQKLNLRMKSLSLDSPESTEQAQKRRAQGSHSAGLSGHSSQSSSSKIHSPSSPVHNRRLLAARTMRMSSVELPDENDRSLSSASTSPCPSPKPHRLLPTTLYVVLYNFKSRHQDELDLKAGYKVTVMDNSDPDWWKGKCLGRIGFFPSKYVMKLEPGERVLQVTHNLQVQDGENGLMLLRDQIVIQVGEEVDGVVMIRSADNKQGAVPMKFLQEV